MDSPVAEGVLVSKVLYLRWLHVKKKEVDIYYYLLREYDTKGEKEFGITCPDRAGGCTGIVGLQLSPDRKLERNYSHHTNLSGTAGGSAMRTNHQQLKVLLIVGFMLAVFILAGCSAAMPAATQGTVATEAPVVTEVPVATEAPAAEAPAATESAATEANVLPEGTQAAPRPTAQATVTVESTMQPVTELRVIELEWPVSIRLGESDVIRLALIPSEDGYTAQAEYDEHNLANQDVVIKRPEGYTLSAVARLDGVGFDISPSGNQQIIVLPNEIVTWRWSLSPRMTGQQRVSIFLLLHWQPDSEAVGQVKESVIFDRNLDIRVISFFGLRKPKALTLGFAGLALSGVLSVWAFSIRRQPHKKVSLVMTPEAGLSIETRAGMILNQGEQKLLQALFKKYQRIILKSEFLSGYSGARTFLAQPILANGQSDAETIIKMGPRKDIEDEYNHFESFVKDRLPPVTARIQSVPVTLAGSANAALQYTCISDPGKSPTSLRQILLANPDPEYLQRLFDTFGPYWWMQRQPYSFRMAQEYDRLLPPHYVLAPTAGSTNKSINPNADPAQLMLKVGDEVSVASFEYFEYRADGKSLTLFSAPQNGKPVFRYRWLTLSPPKNTTAKIVATRNDLLIHETDGFDLFGLPNPLPKLDGWLQETVNGTRSIIHGDLNLENILVGPGNLVWLIDFAQTREGHPLYDFSHLASEIIAHIYSVNELTPQQFLSFLQRGDDPLMKMVEKISTTCLFNPANPREYQLALILSCLGALKYQNLSKKAKHFVFLAAAYYGSQEE